MNEDRDPIRREPEGRGDHLVEYLLDGFDLEKMIAAAERAELMTTSLFGAARYVGGARRAEMAARFDMIQIRGEAIAVLAYEIRDALVEESIHLGVGERDPTFSPGARRDAATELVHDRRKGRGDLGAA